MQSASKITAPIRPNLRNMLRSNVPPERSVLFVCMGNICRSPTAEAVFRSQASRTGLEKKLRIDSAGIGDWHVGQPMDERAQGQEIDAAMRRNRQVCVHHGGPSRSTLLAARAGVKWPDQLALRRSPLAEVSLQERPWKCRST
jgi:protein-tyrosine phosphatase